MRIPISVLVCVLAISSAVRTSAAQRARSTDTTTFRIAIRPLTSDSTFALQLTLDLPPNRDSIVTLRLPDDWAGRTGLFRNIVGLTALTAGAELLPRTDSAHVRIRKPPGAPLTVRWHLDATPRSYSSNDAHNHSEITRDWAQLVGYDALVVPDVSREAPVRAALAVEGVPRGLPFATSFGNGDTAIVIRTTRGDLLHAVYVIGLREDAIRRQTIHVPGGVLTMLVRGHLAIPDTTLSTAVERVVAAERTFWKSEGSPHYLVTIGIASRGTLAGTRLIDAFAANIDSTRAFDPAVLELFAHELMHEWIGGVLHPSDKLEDGSLSWFTEGFTDYLSHRVLWRAGVLSDSAYVAIVNRTLLGNATSPARRLPWVQVVKNYWRDPAAQRQPYMRGELLALSLENSARRAHPSRSLDSVLVAMSKQGAASLRSGFTGQQLVDRLRRGLGAFVDLAVDSTLKGTRATVPPDLFGRCATAHMETRALWAPGFDVDASLRARRLVGVTPGGAAYRAGARDSMLIVRTDIWRGDPAKLLALGVQTAEGERRIAFMPASDTTVSVQQFTLTGVGCRPR